MGIELKEKGDWLVIYIRGKLDIHMATQIEDEVEEIFNRFSGKNFLLNLEDLEYVSSSGLRIFITLQRQLNGASRKLRICNLTERVYGTFEVVELTTAFDIFDSEETALAS